MKLLYIHQYFTFPDTSGGTRSYDLSKEFLKNNIDVTIVTSNIKFSDIKFSKREKWKYIEREGIKLWILNCSYQHNMNFFRRILSFIKFSYYSSFKVLKVNCDLILATSTPLTVALPAILKKSRQKVPFIFEVRDVWPEVPVKLGYIKNKLLIKFLYSFEHYIYRKAECVVALSSGMKKCIVSRYPEINTEIIPNISEVKRFSFIEYADLGINLINKKVILYAGKLGSVNGLLFMANMAKMTLNLDPDIIYLIVGRGNEKEALIEYSQRNNILNRNIFFLDPVSKNSLPYLYSIATMGSSFVIDKEIMWDNSANKFFDTLAAGKPILINHYGWQSEVIKENECGFVMPPDLTDQDIQKFVVYLNDSFIQSVHQQNAKKVADSYSLKNASEKYIKLLQQSVIK